MLKIIRQRQNLTRAEQGGSLVEGWLRITKLATGARASTRVKQYRNKQEKGKANGGAGTNNWGDAYDVLFYAIEHDLYREAKDLVRAVDLREACNRLALASQTQPDKADTLDGLGLLVGAEQARQIAERFRDLPLPGIKAWLGRIQRSQPLAGKENQKAEEARPNLAGTAAPAKERPRW